MMLILALAVLLALGAIVAGWIAHELCHYFLGWAFGGRPFFARRIVFIPTRVDFERPDALKGWQTRMTGGVVVVFPVAFAFLLGYTVGAETPRYLPWVFFFAGGTGVSWLDLLSMKHPQNWKRFTAGEAICRSDFE